MCRSRGGVAEVALGDCHLQAAPAVCLAMTTCGRLYSVMALAAAAGLFSGTVRDATAEPLLSEVLCDNAATLSDWRGERPDWIEIHNPDRVRLELDGWYLSDDPDDLTKWRFSGGSIRPGGYFIVFASGLQPEEATDARWPHASFKLSQDGEFLALVRPDGVTIAHSLDFSGLPQHADVTFGLPSDASGFRIDIDALPGYLASATPAQPNDRALKGVLAPLAANATRGIRDTPFSLSLQTATPDAEIRYTTDGSEPTATTGFVASGPITIDRTTTLRAAAFREEWKRSPVMTRTFLFPRDVVHQSPNGEPPEGWPAGRAGAQVLDYGMDPDIVTGWSTPEEVEASLLALPILSVVTSIDNLFDPWRGIYANPGNKGRAWERPASVELIDPAGAEPGFQANAGLRIRGGFSRTPSNPKHAMRLVFRKQYGAGKLDYPLFGDEGAKEFDFIDLRTSLNHSWAMGGSTRNTILRDVFARDTQGAMGQPYTRSRFYHLFLNGHYWGIYQTQERVTDSYGASYLEGKKRDFDVIKTRGEVTAGTNEAQARLFSAALRGFRDDDRYFAVQGMNSDGSRNPEHERLVDIDNLIDYMLILFYTGNHDGPGGTFVPWPNNYYSIYNRGNPDGFKHFAHDMEHSLDVGTHDMTQSPNAGLTRSEYLNPYSLHMRFVENAHYRKRFRERTDMHFFGEGVLTDKNALARLDRRRAEIERAILAHSARWGDASSGVARTPDDWNRAVERTRSWMQGRAGTVVAQFVRRGWYDGILPPRFVRGSGESLYITAEGGTIYYTTDGTDPLGRDGQPRAGALVALPPEIESVRLLAAESPLRSHVPVDGSIDAGWREPEFDDAGWFQGIPGVGYDDDGDYLPAIRHDVTDTLRGKSLSIYLRSAIDAPPAPCDRLLLGMKFDDGFVAYLNGTRIASANAPEALDWRARAPDKVNDSLALQWQTFPIHDAPALKPSGNVLAIHGLNESLASSDFLIIPSLLGQRFIGGTVVADRRVDWSRITARSCSSDGRWSPPGRFDPEAPVPGAELF